MARHLNLRQIEAFQAVIENGTVHRAAARLNVSQPAISKLIAHLEADAGLKLFDRVKRRLAPTEHAMELYGEVERIFAGVRQVEDAIAAIRRAEQGRLAIGVMPALAGSFIQRTTTAFLKDRRNVFCAVEALSSQWTVERVIARKLDIGLVRLDTENPYVTLEPLMEHPLVCIMPLDHPLAEKRQIEPQDLDQAPLVNFQANAYVGHRTEAMFETYRVRPQTVLVSNAAPTVCEFVAAGLGVSLVHPLMLSGFEHRLVVRRFEPAIPYNFQLCRSANSRNAQLVDAFAEQLRDTAAQISSAMIS